jgi:hypothetical protein
VLNPTQGDAMTKKTAKRLALRLETIQLLDLDDVTGGVGEHPTSRETLPTSLPTSNRVTQCVSATCPR